MLAWAELPIRLSGRGGFSWPDSAVLFRHRRWKLEHRARAANRPSMFHSARQHLTGVCTRLRAAYIENDSFEKIIPRYDAPDTLFYLDPPYLQSTRVAKKMYRHEMKPEQHQQLLDLARAATGMVILSGYSSQLYDDVLGDWIRIAVPAACPSSPHADGRSIGKRTEVLWLNQQAVDDQNRQRVEQLVAEQDNG